MKEYSIPIRLGIADYLLRGEISLFEFGVYTLIHLQADYSSGRWHGSAPRIAHTAPRGADLRKIQRAIEHLADLRLLKPFTVHGRRGNYPVLINKFTVRSGALRGLRLNALDSTDWKHPRYEACAESDAEDAPTHKKEKETKERKNAAKPPADSRYGPFLEFAKSAYGVKHGEPPTWDCFGKDGAALSAFLRRAPHVTPEEWQTRLANYFDSTEAFTLKQGGSLSYFVSRFDTFAAGPILEGKGKSNGTGKLSATDLAIRNAQALSLNRLPS